MASTNFRSFMTAPKAAIMAFKGTSINSAGSIGQMVELAEKARRNGLLALEEDVAKIDDAFTRKGLQLVVDGTDSDLVHAILESEIDGMARPPRAGAPASSRPPAASPRRSASSAPSWASSTCSRTSPSRPTLGPHLRRVHRHALRRRQREPHLPADRQQAEGDVGGRGQPPRRWCSRRSSRSRPATTRACWRRSSRRSSPPAERGGSQKSEDGAPAAELKEAA